jgi:hypothetical protein
MKWLSLSIVPAFLLLALTGAADEAVTKDQSRPVATGVPLEARLVAKTAEYGLSRQDRSEKQYRLQIEQGNGGSAPPVPPPALDLVFEVKNTGAKEIKLWDAGLAGGSTRLELDLKGPGVTRIRSRIKGGFPLCRSFQAWLSAATPSM